MAAKKPIQPKQFAMPIAVEQPKAAPAPKAHIQITTKFRFRHR
jgi:hypothetical protein